MANEETVSKLLCILILHQFLSNRYLGSLPNDVPKSDYVVTTTSQPLIDN